MEGLRRSFGEGAPSLNGTDLALQLEPGSLDAIAINELRFRAKVDS